MVQGRLAAKQARSRQPAAGGVRVTSHHATHPDDERRNANHLIGLQRRKPTSLPAPTQRRRRHADGAGYVPLRHTGIANEVLERRERQPSTHEREDFTAFRIRSPFRLQGDKRQNFCAFRRRVVERIQNAS